MRNLAHYTELSKLFDFPGPGYLTQGLKVVELLREKYPEAAAHVQYFLNGIPAKTLDQQELFTRTFDVQAITTLDVGYVMFGDDYKRAELLANLSREHKLVENDCKLELADHLPNILRLIPKLKYEEMLDELVSEIMVPALLLMIREFDSERIGRKNVSYQKHYKTLIDAAPVMELTIYNRLLMALLEVLKQDFQVTEMIAKLAEWSSRQQTVDFLGLVEKEMEIENNANPVNSGCDS